MLRNSRTLLPALDEFEADFCRERCNASRRCGHNCPEICHADDDDAHSTGTIFNAVFLGHGICYCTLQFTPVMAYVQT